MTDPTEISILESHDNQFKSIYELLNLHSKNTRTISETLKQIQRQTKNAEKTAKVTKKRFQEKLNLSTDLSKFLSLDNGMKLTKAEVMKLVSEYIKTNNLQIEENKRRFKPNKQMTKIFSMKTNHHGDKGQPGYTFVEINKHVSGHLTK